MLLSQTAPDVMSSREIKLPLDGPDQMAFRILPQGDSCQSMGDHYYICCSN